MAAGNSKYDDLPPETIREALFSLDPNVSRAEWWRIGAALKSVLGETGFDMFDDWSKTGTSYNEADCKDTWKSTKMGGGVNVGSLIYRALQNGWTFDEGAPRLSQAEVAQRNAARAKEREAAEAETRRAQGEAAKLANLTLGEAAPAGSDFEYLQVKGVSAHGLFVGGWPLINDAGEVYRHIPGTLIIPIMDVKSGKIVSLQGIYTDHEGRTQKRYLKNGRKMGGCHMIGGAPAPGEPVAFCEGYATGATIHELTGWTVLVCFDAGNLQNIAVGMREAFAHNPFIICADNDQWTKTGDIENPGLHFAAKAAKAVNGCMVSPEFASLEGKPSDFNDLAQREGGDMCRGQLYDNPVSRRSLPKAPEEPAENAVDPYEGVDYYSPLPHVNGKGKPLATIENLEEIIDRLGATVRYNVISKDEEILFPGETHSIDNAANASVARLESKCAEFYMPTEKVGTFMTYIADKNLYNPVATWITSTPWDGVPRVQALLDTVTPVEDHKMTDGTSLKEVLMRRWLISAVAAAFEPTGVSAGGILVFQGSQYLGKTMWFKQLVPKHLRLVQDGMTLQPSDKDSVKQVCSFWLVELGEIDATFRKSDLAALKSFLTREQDVIRRPYARRESYYARRTVFFGSVNPHAFLQDPTGNRRYWTVECKSIDLEAQRSIDMQQMWAEVYAMYVAGEQYFLSGDEVALLNESNDNHQVADPIEDRLMSRLDWGAPEAHWVWKTSTDILEMCGVDRPTTSDNTKAGSMIRKRNGDRGKKSNGKRLLFVPPRIETSQDEDRPF